MTTQIRKPVKRTKIQKVAGWIVYLTVVYVLGQLMLWMLVKVS